MKKAGVKVITSPVGPLWLGATTQGVCAVAFGERPDSVAPFVDIDALQPEVPSLLDEAAEQLMAYFDRQRHDGGGVRYD